MSEGEHHPTAISGLFYDHTGHLEPHHSHFLRKWEAIIESEEMDISRCSRHSWNLSTESGENLGWCVVNIP